MNWKFWKKNKELTSSEYLRKAAQLIDKNGWARGEWVNSMGRYCAVGAINKVVTGAVDPYPSQISYSQAKDVIYDFLSTGVIAHAPETTNPFAAQSSVMAWNDVVVIDKQQVVDAFNQAANILEKG